MYSMLAGALSALAHSRHIAILPVFRWISAVVLLLCAATVSPDRSYAQSAPAKPTGLSAEDGNTQVRLRWTGPNDPTITHWQYAYKLSAGSYPAWTDMPGSDSATRRFTVTGLQNNRTYKFKIRAVNDVGSGPESDEKTGDPYTAAPEKPATFRVIPGDRKALLIWEDADDVSIGGWEYRQKESGGSDGSWQFIPGSDASTTTYTVTGLENGTEYTFQIQAWNSAGTGYPSDEESATPMPSAPGKPAGFSAEPGNGKVTLTWNDPGNDTISKWQYAYKITGDFTGWTDMAGSGASTVRHVVSMLDNDTTYTFKVRAVNDVGDGAESDEVSATPVASAPEKPAGLQALAASSSALSTQAETAQNPRKQPRPPVAVPAKPTGLTAAPGDGWVALAWDDPSNATVTGWQYALKTTGDYGSWIDIPGSDATTTAHTVIELDNGTTHRFKLRAVNASGNGAESDEVTATPVAVPAKPAGFTATPGDRQVSLQWSDPGDATVARWQYALKTTGGYGVWTDIPGSSATTTAHTLTGLDNGAAYRVKLRAVNASGSGAESDEAAATPVAVPAKPTGFTATQGDRRIALDWDDPGNMTIVHWQYRYDAGNGYGGWTDIPGSGPTTTSHEVTGLDNGTLHKFRIRAVNNSRPGAESGEVAATPVPVPAKPTGFTAAPGDGRVALAWDAPGDATITGWQYALKTTGGYGSWIDIAGSGTTTTGYTVTGLDNGTAHRFKLRAVNASGAGAESDVATATPVPVPARPAGLNATAGDGEVSLQWTDPDDATITGWQYRYRTAGGYGDWTDIDGSGAETANHTVRKLANGVVHRFVVRAVNSSGPGAPSGVAAATPLAVPAKPAGFAATAGAGKVVLSWDDPENPTITGWAYNQRQGEGEFEADWTHISQRHATSYTVPGLEIGATYGFKVRADNASGPGAESDEIAVTLPSVPAKPAGLTAAAGDRRVSLAWMALGDSTVTGWQYRYRKEGGGYGGWTYIPNSDADTAGHTVAGLAAGIPHHFRIRAVNSSGEGAESDEAAATPFSVPAKPEGFTATAGAGEVVLSWDDPEDPSVTGYQYVQRREGGEFGTNPTKIPVPASRNGRMHYPVIGLETGVSYGFKLRAIAGEHEGAESVEATATPLEVPDRPTNFTATPGGRQAALRWQSPESPVASWQYRYRIEGGKFGSWIDMPQTDDHDGFTGYIVAGLTNGVAYFFQVRGTNEVGPGPPSETRDVTPEPDLERPTGLKAHAGYGQVLLTWDAAHDPNIRWQFACWIDDEDICKPRIDDPRVEKCQESPWIDIPASSATTTRYTVSGLTDGIAHTFQVRTIAGDRCSDGSNVAYATPKAAATPAERATVKAALAGLAGHVAASADAMIGARFSAGPAQSSVVLAGREVPLFARDSKERMRAPPGSAPKATVRGIGGRELLQDRSFQVALGPPEGEGVPQWSLWHRGDLTRFEGSADAGSRYGGRLLSFWYGADMRWGKQWLAGAALARSKAEVDYAAGSGVGHLKTVLDSVHPYLLRRREDGGTAWITLGGGRGTIENETAGRDIEIADTELATASAGFRARLPAFGALELSASGAAGFARLEADGDARTAIGSLSASTNRQSLGIEAALEEEEAAYYGSLSLRRGGVRGLSLELSGGAGSPLPASSGRADIRLRGLVWHSGREYREFGLTATVRRPADASGRGPSWSLAAAHGAAGSRNGAPEPLWSADTPKHGSGNPASTLNLRAGWGFVSRGSGFTPHAALGFTGAGGRQLALGFDMGPPPGPLLRLTGERRIPRAGAPESRITAALQFTF